jgi:hypothetical protein
MRATQYVRSTQKEQPPLCSLYPYWLAVQLQAAQKLANHHPDASDAEAEAAHAAAIEEIDRITDKLVSRGFAYRIQPVIGAD